MADGQKATGWLHQSLTYQVIGAAQKVHAALGPGFAESTYRTAFCKELVLRNVLFETEKEFRVTYEGTVCGIYRADLVVGGKVIVELKAVSQLAKEHRAQTLSYLKASGLTVALLINFGSTSLDVRHLHSKALNHRIPEIPDIPL